ncbi:MAG: peroxide stress protein YaaA [Desulfobulbaceae bacterium]|nr:peroxide stress protein YaaA [Desulfobulbaceae bacterium]
MQLITSPSKTQQFNGRAYAEHSLPILLENTKIIDYRLKLIDRQELSQLMKTSERLTESTYQLIHDFSHPFTLDNAKQAIFTFQGAAYSAITAGLYTKEQLHHAQQHLFILSGLYGILRPLDLMQPYRLEMGCSLTVGEAANLYQFWQAQITDTINQALTKDKDKVLLNLASKEYSKAVDKKRLQGEMVTITFKQLHKGQLRTIPIHAKKARGLMIHFAVSEQIDKAAGLKDFNLDGYCFSKEDSTATEWIFLKQE